MTRVLVTGATGFIGRHAIESLCVADSDVHAVSRNQRRSVHGEQWHTADLLDVTSRQELLQHVRPERLLHLAWTVEHGRFWHDPVNLEWVDATCALAEEFAAVGGHRLVAAGTCAEYDWSAMGEQPCQEFETPCRPNTLYGTAKHRLRVRLDTFARRRNLSFAWGRLFHLFGPDEHRDRLVPSLVTALLEERMAATGPGTVTRDFMDVRDAAAAFAALLLSDVEGPVNIASGTPTTIAGLAETLADSIGRKELLSVGSLPAREGDPPFLCADVKRLRREVKFHPPQTQRAALEDTLHWWRRRIASAGERAAAPPLTGPR
ncbi:MAG: NAD(P)-dependent oxidoreductase [Vicinamibacterales bacterium]|nr:NAD(P)-dependent oxidoreductase [Vicinamibacterales bacterium]